MTLNMDEVQEASASSSALQQRRENRILETLVPLAVAIVVHWQQKGVRRIKTEFRSSFTHQDALIGCHFNKTTNCCEKVPLEESRSTKEAKTCTNESNIRYAKSSS